MTRLSSRYTPTAEPEDAPGTVRIRREGPLGRITLDRPAQINALTLHMIVRTRAALLRWETDPQIERVLLDGRGERGFCAGGDIRVVHDAVRDRTDAADRLWRAEYLLDALIGDYDKPIVVVLDGVTMGGGIGLGGHALHRIVTERSILAMPEVKIGVAPDVGGTLLFARAPGHVGAHLAMSGDQFGAGDALYLGFADAVVSTQRLAELPMLLAEHSAEDTVTQLREPAPPAPLATAREWIDPCYAAGEATEVVTRLHRCGSREAAAAADRIEAASPLATCVAMRAVARARKLNSLPEVLAQDLRVGLRILESPDPVEGIRAAVIDKTHRPTWNPATLEEVDTTVVESHFAPLGAADLDVRGAMRSGVGSYDCGRSLG